MNNNNYIIHRVTKPPDKKRKIDFIKYKFLLEQKNYYKRLFLYDDFGSSSYYSKNIKPSLRKNPKRNHLNSNKLKKIFFEQDNTNLPSMKDGKEKFSFSSFKANKNSFYKQNISGMNNYSDKKKTKTIIQLYYLRNKMNYFLIIKIIFQ